MEKVTLDLIEDLPRREIRSRRHRLFPHGYMDESNLQQEIRDDFQGFLKKLCNDGYLLKELITYNGKEFVNLEMQKFCNNMAIRHKKFSIKSHCILYNHFLQIILHCSILDLQRHLDIQSSNKLSFLKCIFRVLFCPGSQAKVQQLIHVLLLSIYLKIVFFQYLAN